MQLNKNIAAIRVGDSRLIKVTIRNAETNLPVNIAGDKFFFTVKNSRDQGDADAVVQVQFVAPADASSVAGIAMLNIPKASTANVTPGSYFYDITWIPTVSDPGNKYPVQQGGVSFIKPVTLSAS